MDNREIKKALAKIMMDIANLSKAIDGPLTELTDRPPVTDRPPEATIINFINLIKSEAWPKAVELDEVVQTEQDKVERAENIIDLFIEHSVENLKFLDFGCGDGMVSKTILNQNPLLSVGYDIQQAKNSLVPWEHLDNKLLLTNNFDAVSQNGPYNIILLHDVLDHCLNPIDELKKIKTILAPNGKIIVRCHPWCGRHGGHLYHTYNKAFAHLFLKDEELKDILPLDASYNQKVLFPMRTYTKWFSEANLKYKHLNTDKDLVEKFFLNREIKQHLLGLWNQVDFPHAQMEHSFVDFLLT